METESPRDQANPRKWSLMRRLKIDVGRASATASLAALRTENTEAEWGGMGRSARSGTECQGREKRGFGCR